MMMYEAVSAAIKEAEPFSQRILSSCTACAGNSLN